MDKIQQVMTICKELGYPVEHISPFGTLGVYYRVYVAKDAKGVKQDTLQSRFADTPLISTGFGVDQTGAYITVKFRD